MSTGKQRPIKKYFFVSIIILLICIICESTFYLVWKFRYGNSPIVENYKSQIESTKKYRFDEQLRLVMPISGTTIIDAHPEFVDTFKINEINGLGFFDDGIDDSKGVYALVLGDSFTRGVGSGDNLLYGWVEIVERKLKSVDLLNLGNSGTGQKQQINFFNKLRDRLNYQMVILNFFTGGDFDDNLEIFDNDDYYARLPKHIDKDKYMQKVLHSYNYDIGFEFMSYSPIKSYSIWAVLKVYKRMISRFPPASELAKAYSEYREAIQASQSLVSDEIKELTTTAYVREKSPDNSFTFFYNPRLYKVTDQTIADKLAKHTAEIINEFYRSLRDNKKEFILIVHPSKEEIYLYKYKDGPYDFDYIRNKLKTYLDKDMNILDLTIPMRKKAEETDELLYYREDGHYTKAGYRVVAELVYEFLSKNEFIKSTTKQATSLKLRRKLYAGSDFSWR